MKVVNELKKVIDNYKSVSLNNEFSKDLTSVLENFTQSDLVSLYVYDSKKQTLNHRLFYDREKSTLQNIEKNVESLSMIAPKGCIGKVFLTKLSTVNNYIMSDKDYAKEYDNIYDRKLKAQMLMPIIENDTLLGIVSMSTVIHGNLKKYTQKELALLKASESYFKHIIKKLEPTTPIDESEDLLVKKNSKKNIALELKEQSDVSNDDMLLFFSNTVHDIRTPANSLYGFLELLEDRLEDKRLKKFVTNAKESASFINTLTNSILEIAKNRYESTQVNKTVVCPTKFISEIANAFTSQMLENKIFYFIYISPDIPKEIKIDSLKLQRILINLIGNAYKFTPQKEQINVTVHWDKQKDKLKFSIKDTGIGIDEINQKKLFKAFSQAEEDTHQKYGGSGLGLALSAGYVTELGGKLKLKSQIDVGSEFYFSIPVEIIDNTPKYPPFYNFDKKIIILTEYIEAKYPQFIRQYLIDFGMPKEKIFISGSIDSDATHVICFEEKITSEIVELGKSNQFKLLLVEQKLFSLINQKELGNCKVTSKSIYNGDDIYSLVFSGHKKRILIVDDNKINISLLEAMLETLYVEVQSYMNANIALKTLKNATLEDKPFDIVYLDEHMPKLSGTELLKDFRLYEKENHLDPIYAVSITGDPNISKEDEVLFDRFVTKPFNKNEVREVIESLE